MKTNKHSSIFTLLTICALMIFTHSCEKEEEKNQLPTLTTNDLSEITGNSAICGGVITDDGGASVTARGVCWNTSENPTINDNKSSDGAGGGSFTSSLSNLTPNTNYFVRAYATNSVGTSYGMAMSFTTLTESPIVVTSEVSDITSITAIAGGEVISDGGANVIARGVCWSTSQEPTIEDNKTIDGDGIGSFASVLTELLPNTTYYVRAYATSSLVTAYGVELEFTTITEIPTVVTSDVENITSTTALGGGNVVSDGGSTVTARGVVWAKHDNPTLSDDFTNDGAGTGSYNSSLTNLENNATYYIRAYATNSKGTSYGGLKTFTTLEQQTVTFIYNGQEVTYGVVEFNGRPWLDRNLGAQRVANSINDELAYGDLFQWGREDDGHQVRTSNTTSSLSISNSQPNHNMFILAPSSPIDWNENNNWLTRWTDENGNKTEYDPCPLGWRVPSHQEFISACEIFQNQQGAFDCELKLPSGGARNPINGDISGGGKDSFGAFYWTSTPHYGETRNGGSDIAFSSSYSTEPMNTEIAIGMSIRCIKEFE
jgi:hypothetical protein